VNYFFDQITVVISPRTTVDKDVIEWMQSSPLSPSRSHDLIHSRMFHSSNFMSDGAVIF